MESTGQINENEKKISPDDVLDFIGFGPFQVAALVLASATYLAYGCFASVIVFMGRSVENEFNITVTEYAILPAVISVPTVIGAIFFGVLSDLFGRVWPYALCMGWMSAFSAASAFSNSFYLLIALRSLASFGMGGMFGFINPTVIEFLPVKNRGKVLVLNVVVGSVGLCLSCGLAWWLIPSYPVYGWRYYIIASSVPVFLVFFIRVLFYFESPRYFINKGKLDKAWKIFEVISKINGKNIAEQFSGKTSILYVSDPSKSSDGENNSLLMQTLKMFHLEKLRVTLPLTVIVVAETVGFMSSQLFLPIFLENVGASTYFTMMVIFAAQIPGNLLVSILIEWPEIGRLNSFRIFAALSMVFFVLLTFIQTSITIPVFLDFDLFFNSTNHGADIFVCI